MFPHDLVDAGAPVLLIQPGMLIQVQNRRDDGWWFGFALESLAPSTAEQKQQKQDGSGPPMTLKGMADALLAYLAKHDPPGPGANANMQIIGEAAIKFFAGA